MQYNRFNTYFLGIVLPTKPTPNSVTSPPARDVDVETEKYLVYHRRRGVWKAASARYPKIKFANECSNVHNSLASRSFA